MVGCFYNKKSLNNSLVLIFNNHSTHRSVVTDLYSVCYDTSDNIAGVNLFNWSNVYPDCPEGCLLFDQNICKMVQIITKLDFSQYVNDNGFKIGKVIKCEEIPNTHLHDCLVDVGDQKLQIVCGAKNVAEGLKVVVATAQAILPNGTQINPGELLGHKSYGMLCSAKELNLDANKYNTAGIIELPKNAQVGAFFTKLFVNV